MVKMEFLKRKHFSLWIIATLFLLMSGSLLDGTTALQGVPTWICLGLKSPFIEFSNDLEVLANNSIPLNITKDEQALMHQEGLRKLGTFIKPVDLRDSTTGFVKANLTKKIPTSSGSTRRGIQMPKRVNPIQEEMDQKQIILLDEDTDENGLPASLTDEDRKFIVPMALKNASPDPRIPITTPRTTTTARTTHPTTTRRMTTPATPEFASNIDDLKKHILFLQNLTKHDSNFQSKFVVFPSLQKDKQKPVVTATVSSTTARPQRPIFPYSASIAPPTRRVPIEPKVPPFGGYYHNEDDADMSVFLQPTDKNVRDKITIVPQVLLLNDHKTKTYDNDVDLDSGSLGNRGRTRINIDRPTSFNSTPSSTTTPTTSTMASETTTTPSTTTTTARRLTRPTKLPACVRNPDSPKCIRQRKREELQRMRDREQLLREQEEYLRPHYEPYMQTLNNTKRFAVSIEIPDSFKLAFNESGATQESYITSAEVSDLQILSRAKRSPNHKRRNIGGGVPGRSATGTHDKYSSAKYSSSSIGYYERDAGMSSAAMSNSGGRDFLFTNVDPFSGMGMLPNSTVSNASLPGSYSEPIDLNPDNCHLVDGMTSGQKKQCVLHTSVMPAISRGARATIQECQYQFKNRRWNCSTTDDNTVFGPMTGLGSPEMAFIHALAAATVTSFIARACRDGQLASCGCSRGSRPKQLHDDWTWGGCGDNLEYAYKFATDFIDIREKETRRGTRGVGHPERKRGRLHQQQRRRMQRQQQQMMQADDASASQSMTSDGSVNVTAKQQQKSSATTFPQKEHSYGGTNNQQQHFTNKTVNTDTLDKVNNINNNNHNNNHNNNSNTTKLSSSKGNSGATKTTTSTNNTPTITTTTTTATTTTTRPSSTIRTTMEKTSSVAPPPRQEFDSSQEYHSKGSVGARIKPEDLLELQERITKEILNSKLQEKEMLELQEKINREILNSKVFNMDHIGVANSGGSGGGGGGRRKKKRKNQRAVNGLGNTLMADASSNNNNNNNNLGLSSSATGSGGGTTITTTTSNNKWKNGISAKARSLMNLHNNEAGRRAVIKKTRITCKCHGVSGSCSLITCWQQLSSIREIGDYLREKYEESTEVKLNKRGRLQVKDAQYKVPTAHDLVYMDESPDWCRNNRQLQWAGTHGRVCNKTSVGLDGCGILCCGRGYNTKNIVVRERCNCKFHWCCQVKCDVCVKVLEEHTCK